MLDSFCWGHSHFFIPSNLNEGRLYPNLTLKSDVELYNYFKWIPILFMAASVMFYLPFILWNKLKDGQMQHLLCHNDTSGQKKTNGMGKNSITSEARVENTILLVNELEEKLNGNKIYFLSYVLCEVLKLYVITSLFATCIWLLGEEFYWYGFTFPACHEKVVFCNIYIIYTRSHEYFFLFFLCSCFRWW